MTACKAFPNSWFGKLPPVGKFLKSGTISSCMEMFHTSPWYKKGRWRRGGLQPRQPGRRLEQQREQPPLRQSQQEQPDEFQEQPGLPPREHHPTRTMREVGRRRLDGALQANPTARTDGPIHLSRVPQNGTKPEKEAVASKLRPTATASPI